MQEKKIIATRKVFIAGAYGYGNPGDEAVLEVIISYLKKYNFEFWTNSFNPEVTERKYGINTIHVDLMKYPLEKRVLFKMDILLYGGGTLIVEIPKTLYRMLILNRIFKARNKRIMYLGIGVGFIKSKKLAKLAISPADLITVRDDMSKRLLEDLGYTGKLVTCADPAFLLPPTSENRLKQILGKEGLRNGDDKWIGVCMRVPREYKKPWESWQKCVITSWTKRE